MISLETVDLDSLGIELETFLLVDKKILDVFALIALELDHLAHLGIVDNGAIASCKSQSANAECELIDVPNFFLMTLRIFFWSNFFGRPWTVVRVLRPLRSAPCMLASVATSMWTVDHDPRQVMGRRRDGEAYVECVYGCNSESVLFLRCPRRLRRRGLQRSESAMIMTEPTSRHMSSGMRGGVRRELGPIARGTNAGTRGGK